MKKRIKAVTDRVSGIPESDKPTVFYLTWHDPLKTSGADSLANELIEKAGGINIFADITGVQTVDLETLVSRNPDVMIAGIGMGSGEDQPLQYLLEESRLSNTGAAKNGGIYGIDMDLTGRGGPRIVDGLEKFAKCIHPEIFGNPGD
jgi:iron complex transport system substrate-binding protein